MVCVGIGRCARGGGSYAGYYAYFKNLFVVLRFYLKFMYIDKVTGLVITRQNETYTCNEALVETPRPFSLL